MLIFWEGPVQQQVVRSAIHKVYQSLHLLTFMLVSLPTGWTLGDVGIELSSTLSTDCCWRAGNVRWQISLIAKSAFSSEYSSPSVHFWSRFWAWEPFSKWGRWSSSIEMILRRCPLASAVKDDWYVPLMKVCLLEMEVSSSSSSLQIQS